MIKYRLFLIILLSLLFFGCVSSSTVRDKSLDSMGIAVPTFPASLPVPSPIEGIRTSGNSNIGKVNLGEGSDSNVKIDSHRYKVIFSQNELETLSKITSYVILPKKLRNKESNGYKRYERVLTLIQELQEVEGMITEKTSSSLDNENVFVLFSTEESRLVTLKNYNYTLANKVLNFFRTKYSNALFRKEGPYLITVSKNIWHEQRDFSFLYVNLSKFNNSAVNEIVGAYKERLIIDGMNEISIFEKFHSRLLSFVTNFNQDIHIFQTAVAGGFD